VAEIDALPVALDPRAELDLPPAVGILERHVVLTRLVAARRGRGTPR
jgi:hypothetical protein